MVISLKIMHIVPTEKATMNIDLENKLQFIVDRNANKKEIEKEIERVFEAKVKSMRTMITPKGEKKAIVKFEEEDKAKEIATSLGLL